MYTIACCISSPRCDTNTSNWLSPTLTVNRALKLTFDSVFSKSVGGITTHLVVQARFLAGMVIPLYFLYPIAR